MQARWICGVCSHLRIGQQRQQPVRDSFPRAPGETASSAPSLGVAWRRRGTGGGRAADGRTHCRTGILERRGPLAVFESGDVIWGMNCSCFTKQFFILQIAIFEKGPLTTVNLHFLILFVVSRLIITGSDGSTAINCWPNANGSGRGRVIEGGIKHSSSCSYNQLYQIYANSIKQWC